MGMVKEIPFVASYLKLFGKGINIKAQGEYLDQRIFHYKPVNGVLGWKPIKTALCLDNQMCTHNYSVQMPNLYMLFK